MASWDHEEPKDDVMAKWDTDGLQHAMANISRASKYDPMPAYWTEEPVEEVIQDKSKYDNVNSPKHYTGNGSIECIDYIEDFLTKEEYVGYLRGNIAKYLHRWRYKNGLEDLKKAQWYLNKLVQEVEYEEDHTDKTY
jgi:hypothetical protein